MGPTGLSVQVEKTTILRCPSARNDAALTPPAEGPANASAQNAQIGEQVVRFCSLQPSVMLRVTKWSGNYWGTIIADVQNGCNRSCGECGIRQR